MSDDSFSKFADETEVQMSQIMLPQQSNSHGNVHGGEVLKLVDSIAYVCGARFAGGLCVTAAVDRVDFHQPIFVGELLTLVARIVFTGRTSMDVEIDVFAEDIPTGSRRHTNSCYLTLVHLVDGKPSVVPRLVCRHREDTARFIQARMRREMIHHQQEERQRLEEEFEKLEEQNLD